MANVVANDLEGKIGFDEVLHAGVAQGVGPAPRHMDVGAAHPGTDHG